MSFTDIPAFRKWNLNLSHRGDMKMTKAVIVICLILFSVYSLFGNLHAAGLDGKRFLTRSFGIFTGSQCRKP